MFLVCLLFHSELDSHQMLLDQGWHELSFLHPLIQLLDLTDLSILNVKMLGLVTIQHFKRSMTQSRMIIDVILVFS
jgi:hypothetical protein